ncbi:MAG TPA: NUDIX domain-containing protein [Saprospiraceae bacterium]|nr:NUDIX domain-containing protein [Saprospiraceae bacterium]
MLKDQQTYEINIDGRSLLLVPERLMVELEAGSNQLVMPYRGVKKSLFQYLDTLEHSERFDSILLYAPDTIPMLDDLKSLLLWVPASGGVIENPDGRILLIHRRGYWDLPKGKLDAGEKSKSAALRECTEETGLKSLHMDGKIAETWHVYREKRNQRALKRTKWYAMQLLSNETGTPQAEEDITEIAWVFPEEALQKKPMFQNIQKVIRAFIDHRARA